MPQAVADRSLRALSALGLSGLEAEVYLFLLSEPRATGYRIAQGLGRPVGNIYKALESLESRGAVSTSEEEGNRVAVAAAPSELASAARARVERACAAVESLDAVELEEPDDLLYRLSDREATMARARSLIESARLFVMVVVCPGLVEDIAGSLERAAERTPTAARVFRARAMRGVSVLLDPRGQAALDRAPGQYMNLVVDGRAFLTALFDEAGEEQHTAHWSANPMLSWLTYTGMWADLTLSHVREATRGEAEGSPARAALGAMDAFATPASAGKSLLISRYRAPSPSKRGRPRRS